MAELPVEGFWQTSEVSETLSAIVIFLIKLVQGVSLVTVSCDVIYSGNVSCDGTIYVR